jgi:hypothetical protein
MGDKSIILLRISININKYTQHELKLLEKSLEVKNEYKVFVLLHIVYQIN